MRYLPVILSAIIVFVGNSYASSPPFDSVTIFGKTNTKYNKVALFEGGGSTKPYKTEDVVYFNGQYRISIDIPADMQKREDYYSADMRFWGDTNGNGIKDEGDSVSACHFLIWVPSTNEIFLQVYKGEKIKIDSAFFKYYYNK